MVTNFKPPRGFARATGVIEGRRECRGCGRQFPVHQVVGSTACPHCGSHDTINMAIRANPPASGNQVA